MSAEPRGDGVRAVYAACLRRPTAAAASGRHYHLAAARCSFRRCGVTLGVLTFDRPAEAPGMKARVTFKSLLN